MVKKKNDEGRSIPEPASAADVAPRKGNDVPDDNSSAGELPGQGLTEEHCDFLTAHAVDLDLAQDHVRSVYKHEDLPEERGATWSTFRPTLLYRWKTGEREAWQIRIPDEKRTDRGPKYLFARGAEPPLNMVRDRGEGPILLVEGSNQHLAAASNAPEKFAVYGMFGCWGWSKVDPSFMADRPVYVVFDADMKSNRDVWNAADELQRAAKTVKASGVKFVKVPGSGSTGLDDFLANITDPAKRREAMLALLDDATADLPRAPAKKKSVGPASAFFDENGQILPKVLAQAIQAVHPLAISAERKVAVYRDGVYRTDELALVTVLAEALGDDYRRFFYGTVEDMILGVLNLHGVHLPDHIDLPWMNTLDGMVDLATGELHEWDPDLLSAVQFPVHWDPSATCPTFDRWAKEIIGEQLQDLLETMSTMLDPSTIPIRAPLLWGPPRSGKSTFLRLMGAIAGRENTSAVSLHELVVDNFARAGVYGKVLNTSADLSAKHVQDLTWFKLMTGEDLMRGNRKYGKDFFFVNQALFAFSANELPTVGENSRAYVERMKPYRFDHSFADKIDRTIEPKMMQELPGILNLLVAAWQKRKERGHDLETDPTIQREFEQASDRVAMWMAEEMEIVTEYGGQRVYPGMTLPHDKGSTGKALALRFNDWADTGMGRNKLMQRLAQLPGVMEVRLGSAGSATRGFNVRERVDAKPSAVSAVSATSTETNQQPDSGAEVGQGKVSQETAETAETADIQFGEGDPYADPPPASEPADRWAGRLKKAH